MSQPQEGCGELPCQEEIVSDGGDDMIRSRLVAQRLAFLFLVGCFFFNYPLLSVFNRGGDFFGLPPLYAWLMGSWLALIVLMARVVEGKKD
jgi:hypothetical protein